MILNRIAKAFLLIGILLFTGCGNSGERKNQKQALQVTIAVAANMQFAMEELTRAFTEQTGINCATVISSSGKLTAQIKEGAPFDVFVSANMIYPREVYRQNLAVTPPKVYAYGKLVLWSMKADLTPTMDLLGDESVRHIALANPKTAPYGAAALDVLKNQQLLEKLEDKLVYGESIAQTNQFVITQSAEVGFTAMSVVLSPAIKGKGQWTEIPKEAYSPIEQGVVVVKRKDGAQESAVKFYEFLSSETARKILLEFGYAVD